MKSPSPTYTTEVLQALQVFYDTTTQELDSLQQQHAPRLQCRKGCHACCQDDITIFGLEAAYIQLHANTLLTQGTPHPTGQCAFLDEHGACRIYTARPLICRMYGLPLRWIESIHQKKKEERAICSLNETDTSIDELPAHQCFTATPYEAALALLQFKATDGVLHKISLRDLFVNT